MAVSTVDSTTLSYVQRMIFEGVKMYLHPKNMKRNFERRRLSSEFEKRLRRDAVKGKLREKWMKYQPELYYITDYVYKRLTEDTRNLIQVAMNVRINRRSRRRLIVCILNGVTAYFLHRKFGKRLKRLMYDQSNEYVERVRDRIVGLDCFQFDYCYLESTDFVRLDRISVFRFHPSRVAK